MLEFALREALSLGHNHIGTEHLLLGLVREGDDVTLTVLEELGLGADRIRDEVIAAISGAPPRPPLPRRQRRWDYAVYTLGALDTDDGTLANIGGEGWELVAVVGEPGADGGVFKRPR